MNNTHGYSTTETKVFRKLTSPTKVQDFINSLSINFEKNGETVRSPRFVIKHHMAHCMEGAMLAAAALEYHGHPPLLLDLRASRPDDDHVVAVFQVDGLWGAISKTNHAVLRYRDPIFKNLRELALSYFNEYFDDSGRKNLYEFSVRPLDLRKFNKLLWRTTDVDLFAITDAIDAAPHARLYPKTLEKTLRKADALEIAAGKLVEYKK